MAVTSVGHEDIARSINRDTGGDAEPRADGGLGVAPISVRAELFDLAVTSVGHEDIARSINRDTGGDAEPRADGGLGEPP